MTLKPTITAPPARGASALLTRTSRRAPAKTAACEMLIERRSQPHDPFSTPNIHPFPNSLHLSASSNSQSRPDFVDLTGFSPVCFNQIPSPSTLFHYFLSLHRTTAQINAFSRWNFHLLTSATRPDHGTAVVERLHCTRRRKWAGVFLEPVHNASVQGLLTTIAERMEEHGLPTFCRVHQLPSI